MCRGQNMNNIEQVKELVKKHFDKSPDGIITIGITTKTEDYILHLNKKGVVDKGHGYYGIGSISKTLISSYICKLVEQQKLSLEDTVDRYLDLPSNRDFPTILELATHTSGYSRFIPFWQIIFTLGTTGFSRRNFYRNISSKWIDKNLEKQKVRKKQYLYSDYNYAVLGRIIEKIENNKLINIMNSYCKELGLKDTTYFADNIIDHKSWKWNDNNPFLASGGVRTTVEDMLQYMKFQLEDPGEYLSIGFKKYFRERNKDIFTSFSWNSFRNSNFYWHHGAMGFYRSSILVDRKRNIGVVVMATISGRRIQRMGYLNSSIYRNVKRNKSAFFEFVQELSKQSTRL